MAQAKALGPKLFTLEEAEALLPFIRGQLARFQDLYQRYESCRRELMVLRMVSSSGGTEKNPDSRELTVMERREAGLLAEMREVQSELLEAGCVPKSLQEGLIDFFALKGGRLVFLCWQAGEDRIETWHTLEGGFRGRMPIASFPESGRDAEADA